MLASSTQSKRKRIWERVEILIIKRVLCALFLFSQHLQNPCILPNMRKRTLFIVFLVLGVIAFAILSRPTPTPIPVPNVDEKIPVLEEPASKDDLIVLETPLPNASITSPLTIRGKARGSWFFEATFPIVLVDWDGLIIAEGYATADGEWMTTEYVPFTATITFTAPDTEVSDRGWLILQKNNASGEPQFDNALEIPIYYQ